jgi:hypothetical protein
MASILTSAGSVMVYFAGFMLVSFDHFREIADVFIHRLIVALRETSGLRAFEPLSRTPRYVCLVVGKRVRAIEIERAVQTLLQAGCERVTVSHDGSLSLTGESYNEIITNDMGISNLINSLGNESPSESNPDCILLLSESFHRTGFSTSAITIEKSTDASMLYYAELIPVYSLNPSDVFLAVSMFQSKSQRFGR